MIKKPVSAKILALVTAVLTMTAMCLPAAAFADTGLTKDETVYVVTDNSGTREDVIVSDHLINKNKVKTIADQSNLTDIENVKGEETFKQDGESLSWDAEGNDIYYQGKTDKELPVTMDIVYRLDNKVVSGSDLQGKSGKVEIKINYTNNGEFEGTTVPFVVMTGMVVTDDSFTNIRITKGKVIDDGDKLLVVGMAAPGLAQTLDIGESDLGIGSSVTITGDAHKFAVEDMMTIVTNSFFEDVDKDELMDLDYDDEIKELDKGAKALAEGSDKLYEGLDTLAENMPELQDGVSQLKDGSEELERGTNIVKNGAQELADGSVTLSKSIKKSLEEIEGYTAQFAAGEKKIYKGLVKLKKGVGNKEKEGTLRYGADQISKGMDKAAVALTDQGMAANGGAKQCIGGAEQYIDGAQKGIGNVQAGVETAHSLLNGVTPKLTELMQQGYLSEEEYTQILTASGALEQVDSGLTNIDNALTTGKGYLGDPDSKVLGTKDDPATQSAINFINSSNAVDQAVTKTLTQEGTEKEPTLYDGITALSNGLSEVSRNLGKDKNKKTLIGGSYKLWKSLEQMQAEIDSNLASDSKLSKGLSSLTQGTKDLAEGEAQLAGGASQLAEGMNLLSDNTDTMVNGVYQLDDGAYKLRKGMAQMYKEGIKKIVDLYNDDLKGTLESAENMIDAGKGYKTFTKLPTNMDGSVKFIYRTDMTR